MMMMRLGAVVAAVSIFGMASSWLALEERIGAALVVWALGALLVCYLAPARSQHGT